MIFFLDEFSYASGANDVLECASECRANISASPYSADNTAKSVLLPSPRKCHGRDRDSHHQDIAFYIQ